MMSIALPEKVKFITVNAFGSEVGTLEKHSQFDFKYLEQVNHPVSITMSDQKQSRYSRSKLHPIFTQNLAEGFVRHYISEKLARYAEVDDMYLLALQGSKGIGHLSYNSNMPDLKPESVSLKDIVSWKGKGSIFSELLEKYYLTGIASGVQPKVMVPVHKTAALQLDYIVKSFDSDYPDLAVNEFVCMSAAKYCGIDVPNFWITDDLSCFVVERFDRTLAGKRIAMEDFTVLMGTDKYKGSYENLLKAVSLFVRDPDMIETMYRYIVFSCLVGNGDAHLKNFAVLYEAGYSSVRLAPMYDVVNTIIYDTLDNDLALKIRKSKRFPDREELLELAAPYSHIDANKIIDELAQGITEYLTRSEYKMEYPDLFHAIDRQVAKTAESLN